MGDSPSQSGKGQTIGVEKRYVSQEVLRQHLALLKDNTAMKTEM